MSAVSPDLRGPFDLTYRPAIGQASYYGLDIAYRTIGATGRVGDGELEHGECDECVIREDGVVLPRYEVRRTDDHAWETGVPDSLFTRQKGAP